MRYCVVIKINVSLKLLSLVILMLLEIKKLLAVVMQLKSRQSYGSTLTQHHTHLKIHLLLDTEANWWFHMITSQWPR